MKNIENNRRQNAGRFSVLYDLYVDLLGSLVPGLFAVILGGTVLFVLFYPYYIIYGKEYGGFISTLLPLTPKFHYEISLVSIIFAYIVGAIFFRQDPKKPDAASALSVWVNSKLKDRAELAVQPLKVKVSPLFKCSNEECRAQFITRFKTSIRPDKYAKILGLDAQFPYLYLRCYLAARGLTHLLRFVPWCPNDKGTHGYRTKMYVNIIKIRINCLYPDLSTDLIRNEAHVRLATSVWYASSVLLVFAVFALVLQLLALLANWAYCVVFLLSIIIIVFIIVFCVSILHFLNKCIHYMRVREVIYVLEVANVVESAYEIRLFDDIINKGDMGRCDGCEQINVRLGGMQVECNNRVNKQRM